MKILVSISILLLISGILFLENFAIQSSFNVFGIEDNLKIEKSTSSHEITWSDPLTIFIKLENIGNISLTDISVHDNVPSVFEIISPIGSKIEDFKTTDNKIVTHIDTLKPKSHYFLAYTVKGKSEDFSQMKVPLPTAEVSYKSNNNESSLIATSDNKLDYITVHESDKSLLHNELWPYITALLLIISFIFGGLGSAINNISSGARGIGTKMSLPLITDRYSLIIDYSDYSKEGSEYTISCHSKKVDLTAPDTFFEIIFKGMIAGEKGESHTKVDCKGDSEISKDIDFSSPDQGMYLLEAKISEGEQIKSVTRAVYVGKRKIIYDFYLGGAAGIIILLGLEGISLLFTQGFFQINPQNIITLIGTSLLAGFIPQRIIDNATESLSQKLKFYQITASNSQTRETEMINKTKMLENEKKAIEEEKSKLKEAVNITKKIAIAKDHDIRD